MTPFGLDFDVRVVWLESVVRFNLGKVGILVGY